MPNTNPVCDNSTTVECTVDKASALPVNVLPIGAMTFGQRGESLCDYDAMIRAGICAISEDGKSVMDSALCRTVFAEAARLGIPVFDHCEDKVLAGAGVINDGVKARELSLPGISNSVEDVIAIRDILLAQDTGASLHLCHNSTARSAEFVKWGKQNGVHLTAEVCPHHFCLCDEDIPGDDGNWKMNPPLRGRADMLRLREGLRDGIFDCIATDHAPHSMEEKSSGFAHSMFGIVGLETAFALTYTHLVKTGWLTPLQMVEKLSYNPAKVIEGKGIDLLPCLSRGTLLPGAPADITIADPSAEYVIDAAKFASKGRNTPFHGMKVCGRVAYTVCNGTVAYSG